MRARRPRLNLANLPTYSRFVNLRALVVTYVTFDRMHNESGMYLEGATTKPGPLCRAISVVFELSGKLSLSSLGD